MSVHVGELQSGSKSEPRFVVSPVAREGLVLPSIQDFAVRVGAELPRGEANNRVVVVSESQPGELIEGAEVQGLGVLTPVNAYVGKLVVTTSEKLNGQSETVRELMIEQLGRTASESLRMTKLNVYRGDGIELTTTEDPNGEQTTTAAYVTTYLGTRYL